ncbi:GlxA family transcriptional regulator [Myceligenerans pegani]|uniref:Helix-turn-helix domain-containing protein n=1 Tax=Myceligenerans pegani TaxID=2776917 RepID=A0ABR9MVN9_9MICO|nr:helix-turn-helix domain-containing protein [Myceligenerans sp. TRM 65318]MBE1874822.1 helix-turn-helix domain-containing protein [Myceligenerans sp. TRM 65318]MBE3017093.1 helix-turn-helix domain-containing protein [Myceligenerans sp. TRM 65318]
MVVRQLSPGSDGRPAATRPHRVAVLITDGFIPFELGIPHRIFGIARTPDAHEPLYDVVTCTTREPRAVSSDSDVKVLVEHGPEALETADTVVVPAVREHGPAFTSGVTEPDMMEALGRIRPGTRIVSICTGALQLAGAGLLDGRTATTHWSYTELMRRLHPRVRVNPDVLYVDDGDILTSAGVAAGIDLCLHLLRRDHGAAIAHDVARRTVVPPHRDGGQAQYIERPVPDADGPGTAATRAWAMERLHEPITLAGMAGHAAMSVRTFTRRFREETGESPGQWLVRRRVDLARGLLEDTDLSVERIAVRCGFGTAQSLRAHMQTTLGVTPTQYRRTFRIPA